MITREMWSRLLFILVRALLRPVDFLSARLYMQFLLPLFASAGMVLDGRPRYIAPSAYFDQLSLITLGDRVVISRDVTFLTHDYSLTTALIACDLKPTADVSTHRRISIGDNVFIGLGATILPGTIIDSNAIIGAGSVLRGHFPGDAIYAGNPAVRVSDIKSKSEVWLNRAALQTSRKDRR